MSYFQVPGLRGCSCSVWVEMHSACTQLILLHLLLILSHDPELSPGTKNKVPELTDPWWALASGSIISADWKKSRRTFYPEVKQPHLSGKGRDPALGKQPGWRGLFWRHSLWIFQLAEPTITADVLDASPTILEGGGKMVGKYVASLFWLTDSFCPGWGDGRTLFCSDIQWPILETVFGFVRSWTHNLKRTIIKYGS